MNKLKEYGITPMISNLIANSKEAERIYSVEFADMDSITRMDAVFFAVAHDEIKKLSKYDMNNLFGAWQKVLLDVKGILYPKESSDYSF